MELDLAIKLINHKSITRTAKTVWADVGSGSGLFTNALATLLIPGSKIYAIDKNAEALRKLREPRDVAVERIHADFLRDELNLHNLDGILMANSLHFVQDKVSFINKMGKCLKTGGSFLIIEYDTDTSNVWVPFPLSHPSLQRLFKKAGYDSIQKIREVPSRYRRANIYSVLVRMTETGIDG